MHDIGKITTPESLLNKKTKLQEVRDGIELIQVRFQLIRETLVVDTLRKALNRLKGSGTAEELLSDKALTDTVKDLENDLQFIERCNNPEEFMDQSRIERLREIAARTFLYSGSPKHYLSNDELENLSILRGTLNSHERSIIEDHVRVTQKILEHIAFPDNIPNVAEYASKHHEKLDGTGYHRGLKAEDIPLQARIIAVADIFEALSAKERPYKRAMDIDEVLNVLNRMKDNNFIDGEVFNLIVECNIGEEYLQSRATSE